MARITRRDFLKYSSAVGGALLFGRHGGLAVASEKSKVAFLQTGNRKSGVRSCLKALNINPIKKKDVLIKPNFNTADRVPGSTDNDTLVALIEAIWDMGANSVSLGERSLRPTKNVMGKKHLFPLLKKLDVKVIDFDQLGEKDWVKIRPKECHWRNGFRIARPILEAESIVSTCCLKTHGYGGVFTMSLKLNVGVVPTKRHGYNYMKELHKSPHMRKMIAEINIPFKPALIIMDGVDVFVDGGPIKGKRAKGEVFLASTDRIAIDAVGVAVLKSLGSNDQIMKPKIFEQEQIARAVELGLGAKSPSDIEVFAADYRSREYRDRVVKILNRG
jgi:uncharacterized protein (DUF362 family)